MKKLLSSALTLGLVMTASASFAAFPEKNITLIVPYAAGGSTDIVARALAIPLSKKLGKTVVIKNTTGAGGVIGAAELAKARPDGYTIGFMPIGPIVLQQYQRELPYNSDSFDYIGRVTYYPMVLLSGKNVPWKNFQEMIAEAKANPGKYIAGNPGVGSMPEIGSSVIFKRMGVDVRPMPGTDAASVFAAIAGGTVQFYCDFGGWAKLQNLLPLVTFAHKRSPDQPDVPTLKEMGVDLPEVSVWQSILAPKGVPADVLKVLDEAVFAAVTDPEFIAAAKNMEVPTAPMRAADLKVFADESAESMQEVMTELGMKKK